MSLLFAILLSTAQGASLDILVSPLPERCSYANTRNVSLTLSADASEARDAVDLVQARALYIAALRADDCNADAWEGLGRLLLDQGWYGHAERALGRAVTLQPTPSLWMWIAQAREGQRAWSAAESAYRRVLAIAPGTTTARSGLRRMRDYSRS